MNVLGKHAVLPLYASTWVDQFSLRPVKTARKFRLFGILKQLLKNTLRWLVNSEKAKLLSDLFSLLRKSLIDLFSRRPLAHERRSAEVCRLTAGAPFRWQNLTY